MQTLELRLRQHEKYLDCTSKQIILRGNYYIELIESTFDEEESFRLERYYIKTFECVNITIPGRTRKEYREDNRDEISIKKKAYRKENKDKMLKIDKKTREKHKDKILDRNKIKYTCECGPTLTVCNKVRHEKSLKHQNFINSK
jgi:hypothetical protein